MTVRIITGDCRDMLATLPDQSVHCCVTSPPYFGLRDYGTAQWDGGDVGCDHVKAFTPRSERPSGTSRIGQGGASNDAQDIGVHSYRDTCGKCGAVRVDRQIGLEASLEAYITTLVEVFREVRRVMRDDATLWLNMGDSFASSTKGSGGNGTASGLNCKRSNDGSFHPENKSVRAFEPKRIDLAASGLKPKDLMMVPARVALALQADGWWLRSDIIWAKKAPMPESVTDRPTSAHEHVFLLTKKPRYFYDAEAVKEPNEINPNWNYGSEQYRQDITQDEYKIDGDNRRRKSAGNGWKALAPAGPNGNGRNLRNVWPLGPEPFAAAHFATFPTKLVEPCIKAGTSEKGCCAVCGAPWVRLTERIPTGQTQKMADGWDTGGGAHGTIHRNGREQGETGIPVMANQTIGWQPSCHCNADVQPCVVLDPFAGAGTVGLVADRLGRNAILLELNPEYAAMAKQRISGDAPMFASVEMS